MSLPPLHPPPLCRFWKCPSGSECKYRHALPPGYILKSQMKELLEEEARNVRDVTDIIEEERAKVGGWPKAQIRTPLRNAVLYVCPPQP